jgi:hypothetical protein
LENNRTRPGRDTEAPAIEMNLLNRALGHHAGKLSETDHEHVLKQSEADRAAGYLGIKLAFVPRDDGTNPTDWVRHPSGPGGHGPYGFVADWLSEAEGDGRGLMLFPIDPTERALRAGIAQAGDLNRMLKTLQSHARP